VRVQLDHVIVSARDRDASAKLLAELLGVPHGAAPLRARGIAYRSNVRGPDDGKVNTDYGGRMLYWNEPEGHQWEILTVSYARQPKAQ
jgi:hypothetical protein